ncbi:uncharacterized protein JN550_006071 [Neoarthrinium moseri]|uniref:uncharacterized protein n=1 Tax=Neoarthrinium moseri TaxID=1658444 RepID=UPI001FDBC856|nr:uncharacterized protein JN550_006071 [Neoarthrinium moseri]KAI1869084.1 hypothetical protein JN550_006071 [Neoarthrinium moseri]
MSPSGLPDIPKINLSFPLVPLAVKAFEYTKEHTSEILYNHTARTAYWALILAKKLPQFASIDVEVVVVSSILHDVGMATDKGMLKKELRFEVDGANIARTWLTGQLAEEGGGWDAHRVQLLWDAIALHTTPSIALHKQPEVALMLMATMADLSGPNFQGGGLITLDEYKEVVRVFPVVELGVANTKATMCGLCRDRTEASFDTLAGEFGRRFGVDGQGGGKDEYEKEREQAIGGLVDQIIKGVGYVEQLGKEIAQEASQ